MPPVLRPSRSRTERSTTTPSRDEQRLYGLDAWRESPYYSDRERAALEWTEAVTLITQGHVEDAVYEEVRKQFSETELADLTIALATINAWNRLAISARSTAGQYQPKQELKKGAYWRGAK